MTTISQIDFSYTLSEKYRNRIFIETGTRPHNSHSITLESAALSQTAREALVEVEPYYWSGCKLGEFDSIPSLSEINERLIQLRRNRDEKMNNAIEIAIAFVNEMEEADDDKLIKMPTFLPNISAELFAKKAAIHYVQFKNLLKKREEIINQLEIAARKEKEEERKAESAEKERLEKEKAEWIEANGSDHLQRAFKAGYNCHRIYVKERAAIEFPGFAVDFDDNVRWKSRSCPSGEALDLSEQYPESQIVWVTRKHDNDYAPYEEEECEAVIIRWYLGKYDLIHYV